jgi:Putative zinc-finger
MNELTGCQHVRYALGVYVLGAIDPAGRARVDAHLSSCPGCREELAGLAGVPALLGRVPVTEAARITGFDDDERLAPGLRDAQQTGGACGTLTSLLEQMARRRRANRWRGMAAAAAVVLVTAGAAAGAVTIAGSPSSPSAGGHWESAAAANATTHASADIKYAGMSSGSKLDVRVDGIPDGTICQFWVLGANGQRWPGGSWTVPPGRQSPWYQETSAAPLSGVRGFQITSGGTVLVNVQARPGIDDFRFPGRS